MKTSFYLVVAFLLSMAAAFADEDTSISVSVAIPYHGAHRTLAYGTRNAHFHVITTNTTDRPQNIWKEWCSWGYYGLSFEFTDESGRTWTVRKKKTGWTRNFPDFWTLGPHESLVLDVYFADTDVWEGFPQPQGVSQTYKMRAVFGFSPDDESRQSAVWTGRAVSKEGEYEFFK